MPSSFQDGGIFRYMAEFLWVLLAMVGGVAKMLHEHAMAKTYPRFGLLLSTAVVSGFSGYMTLLLVSRFFPGWEGFAAGVGGWLGPKGMDFVVDTLRTVLQSRIGNSNPPKDGAG